MAIRTKQLGGVETKANAKATIHSVEYFVLDADLASYIPDIGDRATWAPNYSTVTSYRKTWNGPGCWKLTILAEEQDGDNASGAVDSLADDVFKSYSVSEIYFPRQWWGIRLASSQEAGYADDGSGNIARDAENAFLDVNGRPADTSSLLFPGASKDSKGSADYSLCPFANPSDATMPLSLIEQKVKTKLYSVTCYTKKSINTISNFLGVSGEFSGPCRPAPATAGKWRAELQSLSTVKDSKGKLWVKVFRKMTMAPGSLTWSSAKNGGTWSW